MFFKLFPYAALVLNAFFLVLCPSGEKHSNVTLYKDINNNNGDDVFCVEMNLPGEIHPGACVGFFDEIVPSPTMFGAAEENIYKGTERQDVLADQKVFKVQDGAGTAQGVKSA